MRKFPLSYPALQNVTLSFGRRRILTPEGTEKKNEFQVRIELSRPSKFQFGALTIKLLEALWRAASKYTSHSQFPLLLRTAYKNRTINIGFIVSCSEVE